MDYGLNLRDVTSDGTCQYTSVAQQLLSTRGQKDSLEAAVAEGVLLKQRALQWIANRPCKACIFQCIPRSSSVPFAVHR